MAHTMSLRLDETEYQALQAVSLATGETVTGVIRDAVRSYLGDETRRVEVSAQIGQIMERYSVALDKLADL